MVWCGVVWWGGVGWGGVGWGCLGRHSDSMMIGEAEGVIKFGATQTEQIEYLFLNVIFMCGSQMASFVCAGAVNLVVTLLYCDRGALRSFATKTKS